MRYLISSLFEVAGTYSSRIKRMLLFDIVKAVFEGVSLGALVLSMQLISGLVFTGQPITTNSIMAVFGLGCLSLVGKIIFGHLADRNKFIASYSLGAENRLYIGDRMRKVHMGYFSNNSLGEIAGGLSTVIGELETVGVFIIEQILVGAIQTIIMVAFVLPYDLVTGLIILVTLLLAILVNLVSQNRVDRLTERLLDLKLDLNREILEYVKGIGVIKSFGQDQTTAGKLKASIKESKVGFLAVEKIMVPIQFSFLLVIRLGTCTIIGGALLRYFNGSIDASKAISLAVISFVVFSGFELAISMQSLRGMAVKNLKTVIELRQLELIPEGTKKDIGKAEIVIDKISFAYTEQDLFQDLSLLVPEGKTTALVGFSGSGKTSLCNLMARFWDVDTGRIMIDGTDLRDYSYDHLLANFSFVFQDVYLFDDTIRNNIAFGQPEASDEQIVEVAKLAQAHEFIMKLPQGYDTVLQEGGSNLSGGERQRISIARAMLKPSKFVILDEATSSVDPENEKQLLVALKNLLKDKTTIIIAHKISTVRNADQIVVLNRGRIEQIGTHQELAGESGTYKQFLDIREKSEAWTV